MRGSTVLLSMLGLWAGVLADLETIRAASPDELQNDF
jgi:hypothetical protein